MRAKGETEPPSVAKQVAALERLTTKQLRQRYAEVFGEATAANNKAWLLKRIAWRLQANAEGDLSERAKARAAELARDADLRLTPPKAVAAKTHQTVTGAVPPGSDVRLPPPGTILTRAYKGTTVRVKILPDGFEYAGEVYASLSAVAKAITGTHLNGFLFFRLTGKGARA